MSTKQIRHEYIKLGEKVFSDTKWVTRDGAFKATGIEKAVKEVVRRYGGPNNPEELMLKLRPNVVCKT